MRELLEGLFDRTFHSMSGYQKQEQACELLMTLPHDTPKALRSLETRAVKHFEQRPDDTF